MTRRKLRHQKVVKIIRHKKKRKKPTRSKINNLRKDKVIVFSDAGFIKEAIDYEQVKKELNKIHKFNFNTRKNFTPQQKAAITRQYRKYRDDIKAINRGDAYAVKATTKDIENFWTSTKTNKKLLIVRARNAEAVKLGDSINIGGEHLPFLAICRSGNVELKIKIPDLMPLEYWVELLTDFIDPIQIFIDVFGNKGAQAFFEPKEIAKYTQEITTTLKDRHKKSHKKPINVNHLYFLVEKDHPIVDKLKIRC